MHEKYTFIHSTFALYSFKWIIEKIFFLSIFFSLFFKTLFLFNGIDWDWDGLLLSSSGGSGSSNSSSEPTNNQDNGQPNNQGNGQPNGETNGQPNGEPNSEPESSSSSDSGWGPCTCCDQDQDTEGPCGCNYDCHSDMMNHHEEGLRGTCCGCRTHSYNYFCNDCTCTYCTDCYNNRNN